MMVEGTVWQWIVASPLSLSTTGTTIQKNVNDIKSNHKLFTGLHLFSSPRFFLVLSFVHLSVSGIAVAHATNRFACNVIPVSVYSTAAQCFRLTHKCVHSMDSRSHRKPKQHFQFGFFGRGFYSVRHSSSLPKPSFPFSGFRIFLFAPRGRRCRVDGVFMLGLLVPGPFSARNSGRLTRLLVPALLARCSFYQVKWKINPCVAKVAKR